MNLARAMAFLANQKGRRLWIGGILADTCMREQKKKKKN